MPNNTVALFGCLLIAGEPSIDETAINYLGAPQDECPTFCPLYLLNTCYFRFYGFDIQFVNFGNPCFLAQYNCQHRNHRKFFTTLKLKEIINKFQNLFFLLQLSTVSQKSVFPVKTWNCRWPNYLYLYDWFIVNYFI